MLKFFDQIYIRWFNEVFRISRFFSNNFIIPCKSISRNHFIFITDSIPKVLSLINGSMQNFVLELGQFYSGNRRRVTWCIVLVKKKLSFSSNIGCFSSHLDDSEKVHNIAALSIQSSLESRCSMPRKILLQK